MSDRVKRLGRDATPMERFLSKVRKDELTGCWMWLGTTSSSYGWFGTVGASSTGSKGTRAHRWSYENFVGPIPDGMQIDHLCHTRDASCMGGDGCPHRLCVNPDHLEPVAPADNTRRGRCAVRGRADHPMLLKTHCRNGHEFSAENTVTRTRKDRDGRVERHCRTCMREHGRVNTRNARARRKTASAQAGEQPHFVGAAVRTSPHPQPSNPQTPPPPKA